jgi:hypothetical protein
MLIVCIAWAQKWADHLFNNKFYHFDRAELRRRWSRNQTVDSYYVRKPHHTERCEKVVATEELLGMLRSFSDFGLTSSHKMCSVEGR